MLDVDALHELLWLRADSQKTLRLSQSRLADELQTTRLIVHRVLERMCTDVRIRKLPGATGPATRTYEISDPKVWRELKLAQS